MGLLFCLHEKERNDFMNFNPNNQNTLLTKKVAALYEAMQKAGDSGLAFMVVDSLNSLANYARFLAEQEILI